MTAMLPAEGAAFLLPDQSEAQHEHSIAAVCTAVCERRVTVLGLVRFLLLAYSLNASLQKQIALTVHASILVRQVQALEVPLTAVEEFPRSRAVLLLAEVPPPRSAQLAQLAHPQWSARFHSLWHRRGTERARCCRPGQQVFARCEGALATPGEVHHLAAFFCARLADWCLPVVPRGSPAPPANSAVLPPPSKRG